MHALRPAVFGASRCAVAAMEFALLAPIMALLTVGVFDLSKAAILWEQVWDASRSIAESASTLAIQPTGATYLTQPLAQQALSLVFAEVPWIANNIENGVRSAVLTSVSYSPVAGCTANCAYIAAVKWSKAYACSTGTNCVIPFTTGTAVLRPCGTLTQVAAGSPVSLTTVATSGVSLAEQTNAVAQPTPFLIADVRYTFRPWFFNLFSGDINLWGSSFWIVRISQTGTQTPWTLYATAPVAPSTTPVPITGDATAVQCP